MRCTIRWLRVAVFLFFFQQVAYAQTNVSIQGKVLEEATQKPIVGAKIILVAQNSGQRIEMASNEKGIFGATRDLAYAGPYQLTINADGYFEFTKSDPPIEIGAGLIAINIFLISKKTASVTIDVYADPYEDRHLNIQHIELGTVLPEHVVNDVPAPGALKNMKHALTMLPGVTQDFLGRLHINGSSEQQINFLLGGFNIADPITGMLEVRFGSQSVIARLFAGRYGVECGPGGGGCMMFDTPIGSDKFKLDATNFLPGFQTVKGLSMDSWVSHFNVSGPVIKGRAWFYAGLFGDFRKKIFIELPEGQDSFSSLDTSAVLKFQANLTSRNIISLGGLVNYLDVPYANLSPLDPRETTFNRLAKRNFFSIKDQHFFSSQAIIEFGYGMYRSEYRETPQGTLPYQFFDAMRRGNYFSRSIRNGDRDQLLFSALFPTIKFAGSHQLKTGVDTSYSRYAQDIHRTSIEYYRVDGTKRGSLAYRGNGTFRESNVESGWFLQDRWMPPIPWILLEGGIRFDRDGILRKGTLTWRTSLAIKHPWFKDRTKFSAGYGRVPEKSNLRLFSRDQDQDIENVVLDRNGSKIGTWITYFAFPRSSVIIPSIGNMSLGIEQKLWREVYLEVNWLRKRIINGYAFIPKPTPLSAVPPSPFTPQQSNAVVIYELGNIKRESYDSIEFALHLPRTSHRRYEWSNSYTRSRGRSNAAANVDTDDPINYENRSGVMPWDTPNRLVSYGLFPLDKDKKNELRYHVEWRDGFPYSVYNGEYQQVGELNSWRMPRHFSINVQFGKKVNFLKHYWELRVGVENLTNRDNAMLAIQNMESPLFGTFIGRQPRRYVFGIRLLDNKKPK